MAARLAPALLFIVPIGCGLLDPIEHLPARASQSGGGASAGSLAATGGIAASLGGASGGRAPTTSGGGAATSGMNPGGATAQGGGAAEGGKSEPSTGGRGSGGTSGTVAGNGGSSGGSPCSTHRDCGELARCRAERCVELTTATSRVCPEVLGGEHASDPNAIFIGAFAPLGDSSVEARTVRTIYELVLDDFNDRVGGLRGRAPAPPNPLVVILCNNDNVDTGVVPAALDHLVTEVGVPAVLAAMDINQLRAGVQKHGNTFFVSALGGSEEFASISKGRAWTMLGQPADYAAIYAALMPRVEAYVRRSLTARPIRVAAVLEDVNAFEQDLARAVLSSISFNGQSVLANTAAVPNNFASHTVTGAGTNIGTVVDALYSFQPDVVLSFASDTFTARSGVMTELNQKHWAGERPFYVLSPENVVAAIDIHDELDRLSRVDTKDNTGRVIGVSSALSSPENPGPLGDFVVRLVGAFPEARTDFGNYYDAFYFLTYALYASGTREAILHGTFRVEDIADGMRRLINLREAPLAIDSITNLFDILDVRTLVTQVYGTLGAPDFDGVTGMRRESGSVYCFDSARFTLQNDVLRYDRATNRLVQEAQPRCLINFLGAQ